MIEEWVIKHTDESHGYIGESHGEECSFEQAKIFSSYEKAKEHIESNMYLKIMDMHDLLLIFDTND